MNMPDNNRWTALMYAANNGCVDAVQSLLKFGAEVNVQEVRRPVRLFILKQVYSYLQRQCRHTL